jgi:hypothetical protein
MPENSFYSWFKCSALGHPSKPGILVFHGLRGKSRLHGTVGSERQQAVVEYLTVAGLGRLTQKRAVSVALSTTCRRWWICRILEAMTSTASLLSEGEIFKQDSLGCVRDVRVFEV